MEANPLSEEELLRVLDEGKRSMLDKCLRDFAAQVQRGDVVTSTINSKIELSVKGSADFASEIRIKLERRYPSVHFQIAAGVPGDGTRATVFMRRKE